MALIDLSLPDVILVTDSLAASLESLAPRLEDVAVVTDELGHEADYVRGADDAVLVADEIEVELEPFVRVLEDAIGVGDAIEALMEFGVPPVVITSVTPLRGGSGDTVVIVGTGFSPDNNNVMLTFIGATIVSESTTEIVATLGAPSFTGDYGELEVRNFDNNSVDFVPFWVENDLADLQALRTTGQVPGTAEDPTIEAEDPDHAEARDHERLATVAELLQFDLADTEGDLITHDGTGLVGLDGSGTEGRVLLADSGEDAGIRWGEPIQATLLWGGLIDAASEADNEMVANGEKDDTPGATTEHASPYAGTIDWVWLYQYTAGANADRLDQVKIDVNGVNQYDSGAGLAIAHGGVHRADPNVTVAVGDLVELIGAKTGTDADMALIGGVRIIAD